MGRVIDIDAHRLSSKRGRAGGPKDQLPILLARLLAAGATDFARVALDAWGNQEMDPDELVELCNTYAAIAGLETVV